MTTTLLMTMQTNLHGVGMCIYGIGVIITGKSGIGKTDLGLELVSRGHQFIADDLVLIEKVTNEKLIIYADNHSTGFAHVKGIGFIDVERTFGNKFNLIKSETKLDLILNLTTDTKTLTTPSTNLINSYTNILGNDIPVITLSIGTNRNLSLLTEIIIKNYTLLKGGYNSNETLIKKCKPIVL